MDVLLRNIKLHKKRRRIIITKKIQYGYGKLSIYHLYFLLNSDYKHNLNMSFTTSKSISI